MPPSTRVRKGDENLYAKALLELPADPAPLTWSEVFACPVRSVELEIGTGKGKFLRKEAEERPDVGFLGIERAAKWLRLAAGRAARDGRANLMLVRADAFEFLTLRVAPGSLAGIHVYFPDPWPKKRHGKRRLLRPALYQLSARALATGGLFAFATDVGWYFDEAVAQMAGAPWFDPVDPPPGVWDRVTTNYALKYAREGRSLHLTHYRRNALPTPEAPPLPVRPPKGPSTSPSRGPGA